MRPASVGPMPGSRSSVWASAVLRLIEAGAGSPLLALPVVGWLVAGALAAGPGAGGGGVPRGRKKNAPPISALPASIASPSLTRWIIIQATICVLPAGDGEGWVGLLLRRIIGAGLPPVKSRWGLGNGANRGTGKVRV